MRVEPPDPCAAFRLEFAKCRKEKAASAGQLRKPNHCIRRLPPPYLVQFHPEIGHSDSMPYAQGGFFPGL